MRVELSSTKVFNNGKLAKLSWVKVFIIYYACLLLYKLTLFVCVWR